MLFHHFFLNLDIPQCEDSTRCAPKWGGRARKTLGRENRGWDQAPWGFQASKAALFESHGRWDPLSLWECFTSDQWDRIGLITVITDYYYIILDCSWWIWWSQLNLIMNQYCTTLRDLDSTVEIANHFEPCMTVGGYSALQFYVHLFALHPRAIRLKGCADWCLSLPGRWWARAEFVALWAIEAFSATYRHRPLGGQSVVQGFFPRCLHISHFSKIVQMGSTWIMNLRGS